MLSLEAKDHVDPTKHTQQPITTGTSVIAIKYRDGVMMIADSMVSYGSLQRYKKVKRIHGFGKVCLYIDRWLYRSFAARVSVFCFCLFV